jgi:acetyl esterase/lipase
MDLSQKNVADRVKCLGCWNGAGVVGGLIYLTWPRPAWLGNLSFVLYLMVLSFNAVTAYRFRAQARGTVQNVCAISMAGMLVMMVGNFLYSNSYSVSWRHLGLEQAMVVAGYVAPLLSGIWLARRLRRVATSQTGDANVPLPEKRKPGVVRAFIGAPLALFLFVGLVGGLRIFSGHKFLMQELLVPDMAVFFAFVFLFAGILLASLLNGLTAASRGLGQGIFAFSGATWVLFMLPLLLTPFAIVNAQRSFDGHFQPLTFSAADTQMFRPSPFNGMACLLGVKPEKVRVRKNILYYRGETGVDQGVRLYFDAYLPPEESQSLPGRGSVLIRIHGGGWKVGDKGAGNILQMNKYFAAQGYVVFDVQYGLYHAPKGWAPSYVSGDFSADDMVRHIGLFTKYLAAHTNEFETSLNSVFVSGGSAGGQLAGAVALGITSQKYPDWFASGIRVRGLIPFYPAFTLLATAHIRGSAAVNDPGLLIDSNSPPCLIFQGTADTLVDPKIPAAFCQTYQAKAVNPAAVLLMPLAGHASDLYFPGNYNQIFLYHMERFMARYRR